MKKIYLSIPYSGIKEKSFKIVNEVAAKLLQQGYVVYSPISQGHAIVQENELPNTREFWEESEKEFISWCDTIMVVVINEDGHNLINNSKGCQSEINMANEMNKNVKHYYYKKIIK